MILKCTKCKKSKDCNYFPLSKQKKNGYSSWCKECNNASSGAYIKIMKEKNIKHNSSTTGSKICYKCKIDKPLTDFKIDLSRKDCRNSYCKNCHSKNVCLYQLKNRDKANLNNSRYKKTEKGKISIKKYKNSDACKDSRKRYNQSSLGYASSARCRNRRRDRTNATKNDLTAKEWDLILKKQKNKCNICKINFKNTNIYNRAERDHIIPLIAGGGLTFENVQGLCRRCNAKKWSKVN